MDDTALRTLVRQKLLDGRLPLNKISRLWGGPADGEICDACDKPITKQQLIMEGFVSMPTDKKPIQFHLQCFQFWETERHRGGGQERTV